LRWSELDEVTQRPHDREQGGSRRILGLATHNSTRPRELDSMIVTVALVPRLDCRYRSLSRRTGNAFASDFSRYNTALPAIVVLTSTPTRTKPPRQLTWYHAASTNSSDTASGCRFSIRTPTSTAKTMVPGLHSVCAFLISMPCRTQRASQPTPPRARPDVSSSAHPCP